MAKVFSDLPALHVLNRMGSLINHSHQPPAKECCTAQLECDMCEHRHYILARTMEIDEWERGESRMYDNRLMHTMIHVSPSCLDCDKMSGTWGEQEQLSKQSNLDYIWGNGDKFWKVTSIIWSNDCLPKLCSPESDDGKRISLLFNPLE